MKLDAKAMGPFVFGKVARIYGQCMMIEHPDGKKGHGRWAWACTIHISHLALFNKPYIAPQEITIEGKEDMPKTV